jgi:hypothetical protein
MTKRQAAILQDLQRMPKKVRLPSGALPLSAIIHYDWRYMNGLFDRGLVAFDSNGNVTHKQKQNQPL